MSTPILAPGLTAGTSTDVVLASGVSALLSLYTTAPGTISPKALCSVHLATPGESVVVGQLSASNRTLRLEGPGTYRVKRPEITGVAVGIATSA